MRNGARETNVATVVQSVTEVFRAFNYLINQTKFIHNVYFVLLHTRPVTEKV